MKSNRAKPDPSMPALTSECCVSTGYFWPCGSSLVKGTCAGTTSRIMPTKVVHTFIDFEDEEETLGRRSSSLPPRLGCPDHAETELEEEAKP